MKKVLLVFGIVLVFGCGFPPDCKKFLNENVRPGKVKGIVVAKKGSKEYCFGEIIVKDGAGFDTLKYIPTCNFKTPKDVWSNIDIGDSISKVDGEIDVTIIRNHEKKVLEIPCLQLK